MPKAKFGKFRKITWIYGTLPTLKNVRFKIGHTRVETRVLETCILEKLAFRGLLYAFVRSVLVRFKKARVEQMRVNIRVQ